MEQIVIKEVTGRCELRRFIKFPNKLFKNVPTYIPALMSDELGLLTQKNPSLEHCDLKLWLAYRGKEIVGRVAGIINYSVNERWNKKAVRFGWFDFVEDYDVFTRLLDTVVEYGKAKGMDEVEGPFGFTDMDKECWVIEGFDQRQNISTLYNPKYYIDFIQRAGYEIPCRWAQYKIPASQPIPEKVGRINELILQKYNLKLLKFKSRKEVYPYAKKFFLAINAAFKDLYDFVPMTDKEIDVYINEYFPFINLEFANFVVDKNNKLDIQLKNIEAIIRSKKTASDGYAIHIDRSKVEIEENKKGIQGNKKLIQQIEEELVNVKHWRIYLNMVGRNGIGKMVLRDSLPVINAQINQLLSDVCDFTVEIRINDKNDIMFYIVKDGVFSDISSGSGFEKTAAALALRVVLGQLSILPKLNSLILDEVTGRVAQENLENIHSLLEKIADKYQYIMLITHNDSVKSWASEVINVIKEGNVSRITAKKKNDA